MMATNLSGAIYKFSIRSCEKIYVVNEKNVNSCLFHLGLILAYSVDKNTKSLSKF